VLHNVLAESPTAPLVPLRAEQQEQARRPPAPTESIENRSRQPVLWVPPTAPESAIKRTRSGAEQRARTTAAGRRKAAPNGTSGVLADSKHAGRRATWAAPQTGEVGHLSTLSW
jgi:hypothetical protein